MKKVKGVRDTAAKTPFALTPLTRSINRPIARRTRWFWLMVASSTHGQPPFLRRSIPANFRNSQRVETAVYPSTHPPAQAYNSYGVSVQYGEQLETAPIIVPDVCVYVCVWVTSSWVDI